jgi:hypothetical protein
VAAWRALVMFCRAALVCLAVAMGASQPLALLLLRITTARKARSQTA